MNQFVILSFGLDPLNWPSFIEIGEIACSTPAWCTHGLTLKMFVFFFSIVNREKKNYTPTCKHVVKARTNLFTHKTLRLSTVTVSPTLAINDFPVTQVATAKSLGVTIDGKSRLG